MALFRDSQTAMLGRFLKLVRYLSRAPWDGSMTRYQSTSWLMRTLNFVIELYYRSKTIFVEYQRPIPSVDQGYSGLTTKNVDFWENTYHIYFKTWRLQVNDRQCMTFLRVSELRFQWRFLRALSFSWETTKRCGHIGHNVWRISYGQILQNTGSSSSVFLGIKSYRKNASIGVYFFA